MEKGELARGEGGAALAGGGGSGRVGEGALVGRLAAGCWGWQSEELGGGCGWV